MASLSHNGRRRVVLGHTENTLTLNIADELNKAPCIVFVMF